MSFNLPRPISEKSKTCLLRFQQIGNEVRRLDDPEFRLPLTLVSDEMARFRMWASNIGAVHDPSRKDTSLDLRLRDSPKIAARVSQFLEDLAQDLHSVWQIASGQRPNQVGTLEVHEEPGSTFNPEDSIIVETEHLSEIRELFETCQDCISCLFRLSVAIRKATNRDKYATSARRREDPYDELFDIAHVGHKFPKVHDKQPWLEARLGRAITRRREFLRYSKEHEQRLGRGVTQLERDQIQQVDLRRTSVQREGANPLPTVVDAPDQRESTLGSTKATTLDAALLEAVQQESSGAILDSEASESSYATTEITAETEGELSIPPLPDEGKTGKDFDCPYCRITQSFKGKAKHARKRWKEHVLHDLRPYVCTFPRCDLAMFPDKDSWFKHELDDHRLEWYCQFCSHSPMETSEKYEAHLRNSHSNSLKGINLGVMLQSSKQSVSAISSSSCPFCDPQVKDEDLPLDAFGFKNHVAKHMEQLALFAIPRTSDVGDGSFTSIRAALTLPNMSDSIDVENALANKEREDLPLHHAAYEGRGVDVNRLLQAGHDIDALGRTWGTPLGAAIEGKHLAVVKLLLDNGADIQIPCGKYETALKAAAALNNPTLVKVVADADNRNQRPRVYGEIKWKMETIANNLDNISREIQAEMRNSYVTLDSMCDLEGYAGQSGIISQDLRTINSDLDPRSETQAAGLKSVIPLLPNLLRSLETLHDVLSLLVSSFKIDTAEYELLGSEKPPVISHFKESILEALRHIKDEKSFNRSIWAPEGSPLVEVITEDSSSILQHLKTYVERAIKSPREINAKGVAEKISEFQSFMINSYEALSKKLQELDNKEERLNYFEKYPYESEDFHRRKERELLIARGSDDSTLAKAREALFGHSEPGTSQAAPAQLYPTAIPGAWPSDDVQVPVVQDELPSNSSSKAQLLDTSVDPKLPVQDRMSDLELTPEVDAEIKKFRERIMAVIDDQWSSVDSMRSLTIKFANKISKTQESVLTSAFNTLEAATTTSRVRLDFTVSRITKEEWENMNSQADGSGHLEHLPPDEYFKRRILPIHVALGMLHESLSEASAETPNDQELPSWTAVMEFFEWKAGYAFESCLSDCAVILSEMSPDIDGGPIIDRSQLAGPDPGAQVRLDQMIEHRKLFSPTSFS